MKSREIKMKSQEINMQKVGLFGVKSLTFWCKKSHFLG